MSLASYRTAPTRYVIKSSLVKVCRTTLGSVSASSVVDGAEQLQPALFSGFRHLPYSSAFGFSHELVQHELIIDRTLSPIFLQRYRKHHISDRVQANYEYLFPLSMYLYQATLPHVDSFHDNHLNRKPATPLS